MFEREQYAADEEAKRYELKGAVLADFEIRVTLGDISFRCVSIYASVHSSPQ